ncbi:MAG: DUF4912 domain-containing protein [Candidatus Omnitrophota bacterium]
MAAVARKIKRKKVVVKKKARKVLAAVKKKSAVLAAKKVSVGVEEVLIGQAKFSHPENLPSPRSFTQELPFRYDRDSLILQVRDPWWLHAYWEVKDSTLREVKGKIGEQNFYQAKRVLRVYDVTDINFDGNNANRFFDIYINEHANSWYIDSGSPGKSWCVDFGLLLADGKFITILRSNVVQTPAEGPSWITDEEWMVPDDMFSRLYGMGFGLGKSSPVGKAWRQRLITSGGVASMASPVKKPGEKKFWLAVDCELIVYGATEPDAHVTVQGKNIKLRKDGTFTLRFALPDGKQHIPVKARSCDGTDERSITPIVARETK